MATLRNPRRRRARINCRRAAIILAASVAPLAWANTDYWNDGSDNWSVGSNWLSGNVPAAGDTVNVTQSDATTRIVTFDAAATSGTGFAQLTIDATGSGSMTLSQSVGVLNVTGNEYVGSQGAAIYTLNGGTNSLNGVSTLWIGYSNGASVATYNLPSGTLNSYHETVGNYGNGIVAQSNGSNNCQDLVLGAVAGGNGTYTLSGGVINVQLGESIGEAGGGVFNQSGGTNSFGPGPGGYALSIGSHGAYNLSGGLLNAFLDNEIVGSNGSASFTQTGGSNQITRAALVIGASSNGTGSYSFSEGYLLIYNGSAGGGNPPSYFEYVGFSGNGVFTQTGGSNYLSRGAGLCVGYNARVSGTYTLSGGVLQCGLGLEPAEEEIGVLGNGVFNQTGGTNSIFDTLGLFVGASNGGSGTYNLSGNGTLDCEESGEYIGGSGTGIFNQNGGHNLVDYELSISSQGTYNLNGGTLVGYVDLYANGTFNYNGGTLEAYQFSQMGGTYIGGLNVSNSPDGISVYYFMGGNIYSGSVSSELVGYDGVGTFNQSGGTNSVGSAGLIVGYQGTNSGTYNLSGGVLSVTNSSEYVGYAGKGTVNQTGGSNTAQSLYIAYTNGASGSYSLSGGVLTSSVTVNNGQFTQSGGTASLGALSGSGTVTLGGGSSIAQLSVSSLSQSAVTVTSGGYLAVASNMTQVTNRVTSLAITGSGQLDLANQSLLTSTSPSLIRQYLTAGYNGGAWNGTGGISSMNAAANPNHSTALGYTTGTSAVGIALGVGSNQTFVKYVHYGDANLDGTVGQSDLNIVLNNYLSGKPGTWDTGDFTYAGKVDITDLNLTMSNYGATAATTVRIGGAAAGAGGSGAHTLTGVASPGIAPPPSGQLEMIVYTNTGDVQIVGNNADIASLQITSASGGIVTANWLDLNSQGNGNWSDTVKQASGIGEYDNQFVVTGDSLLLNGIIDYGDIYNTTTNAEDLVFEYGLVASNQTTVATDLGSIFYVPEPTTLSLMGLAAVGLLGRRRRRVHVVAQTIQNKSNRK